MASFRYNEACDKYLEAIELVKQFINDVLIHQPWHIQCKPQIKAALLYVSVAKGTNRIDSDIDVMVVLPLEIELQYTQGEYCYYYQEQTFNIVLRSIERLREIADEHNDNLQKEVFRNSQIIFSMDDEVKDLVKAGDLFSSYSLPLSTLSARLKRLRLRQRRK